MRLPESPVGRLVDLLAASRHAVAFTGAGISTESGISDFRSPGGVWSRFRPVDFQQFVASADMRRAEWRRKFERDREVAAAGPNRGHRAIARLVVEGTVRSVITQNVDGLHQRAGVPASRLIELHGNGTYARCLDCGTRHELEPLREAFEADGTAPACAACGGIVKSATVSFGQPMPEDVMRAAHEQTAACDLFLAIGSSLLVYPAAGFPALAKERGAALAIVNREPTDLDGIADLVIHDEIGATLGAATGVA